MLPHQNHHGLANNSQPNGKIWGVFTLQPRKKAVRVRPSAAGICDRHLPVNYRISVNANNDLSLV